jgi:hypothetical protein
MALELDWDMKQRDLFQLTHSLVQGKQGHLTLAQLNMLKLLPDLLPVFPMPLPLLLVLLSLSLMLTVLIRTLIKCVGIFIIRA